MSFFPSIQAYLSSHVVESGHNVQAAVDWTNEFLYTIGAPSGTVFTDKFNLLSGAELAFQTASAYMPVAANLYPINFNSDGIYFTGFPNTIIKAAALDLSQIAQATPTPTFDFGQGTFSPITNVTGEKWMLCTGPGFSGTGFETFTCVDTNTLTFWAPGAISYANTDAAGCAGPAGSGLGYVLSAGALTNSIKLFQVDLNTGSVGDTLLNTIAAATIDAGWTTVDQNGMCLDQTDNNLLVFCQGQVGATNPFRMLKLNATTGALIWNLIIPGIGGGAQVSQSVIKSSTYVLLTTIAGSSEATVIDTATGTITSTFTAGLAGLVSFGSQCFNDQTGVILGEHGLTSTVGSPTLLNSTPADFGGWASLYAVPPASELPPGGGGSGAFPGPRQSPPPAPPQAPLPGPPWVNMVAPFSMTLATELC